MSLNYIIGNFHNLTEINASFNSNHHCFGLSSQLDFNGSGIHNNIALKNNATANYHSLRPTLPYFVDNARLQYNYCAKNCLIYCQNKNLLLSSHRNRIIGLNIEENKVTDIEESDVLGVGVTKNHYYSYDESLSCEPFRYYTQHINNCFDFYEQDLKPILELKLNNYDENKTQIMANSRNKIRFFRFKQELNEENDNNFDLELFHEINDRNIDISCPQSEPMFENSDRNPFIEQEILVSYTCDNTVYNYDIETNDTIWSSTEIDSNTEPNKQIGFYWSQCHKRMFFYGEHQRLLFIDTRGYRDVVQIYLKGGHNLYDWEQFYAICPNKLNSNQLYVATDYHIFLTDIRFPKNNLIQLNHMLPNTLVRSLKSIVIENSDESKTELLISSNFHRNCLMSFKSSSNIQPTSLHLPLHLSTPKDFDKVFEDYFLRGLQIIPFGDNLGFSVALLTNSGDIFMQDLYHDNEGTEENADKCFSGGIGSSNLALDDETVKYMTYINNFIDRMHFEKDIEINESHKCLNCTLSIKCEFRDNLCECVNTTVFNEEDFSEESDDESNASTIETLNKHIGRDVIDMRNRISNFEQFCEKSNDFTKNLYKLWNQDFEIPSHS